MKVLMRHKQIIFILALHFTNMLMSMEIILSSTMPSQWWYLDKIFPHDKPVSSAYFDGQRLITASDGNARIFDTYTRQEITCFEYDTYYVSKIYLNSAQKHMICHSNISDERILKPKVPNIHIQKEISSILVNANNQYHKRKRNPLFLAHKVKRNTFSFSVNTNNYNTTLERNSSGEQKITITIIEGCLRNCSIVFERDQSKRYSITEQILNDYLKNNNITIESCLLKEHTLEITALQEYCLARIYEYSTRKHLASFRHNTYVNDETFDPSGKYVTTASNDGNARIFKRHDTITIPQVMLKNALLTWLLIEKPDKKIESLEQLLTDVEKKYELSYEELITTWSSFPETMQGALLRTMLHRIQEYGK